MPIECVRRLAKHFGYTTNAKGYKVLNNVRVIQGDGIDIHDVEKIVEKMLAEKWSIDNIAFGMGGGLLQKNDRDTQKFAMKCCAARIGDEWVDVYKNPVIYNPETWEPLNPETGDAGFKTSKKGRLELMYNTQTKDWKTMTIDAAEGMDQQFGWVKMLDTVYENGKMVKDLTLDQVRANANGA
jgi:nicotinamide phosphoribosyltransferase